MSAFTDDTPDFWEGVDDDVIEAFGPTVPATYQPKTGDPVPLDVLFRKVRGMADLRAPGLAQPMRVGGVTHTAKGKRHVLEGAREGETLTVKGQSHTISKVSFEGVGLVLLHLQGPIGDAGPRNVSGPAGGR